MTAERTPEETPDPAPEGGPLVLIAEDEPIASMALRAQLEALDYRVLGPARDGLEAVALGACFPVDLGLFDMRMPRLSGIEAAHGLHDVAPTPVVLLTGVGTADLPDPIPEPPVFGVLHKPIGLADLQSGLGSARRRFLEWIDRDPERLAAAIRARKERETIAEAVRSLSQGQPNPGLAATRLFQTARDEGRPLIDLARDLLARR